MIKTSQQARGNIGSRKDSTYEHDFYSTPPEATLALIHRFHEFLTFGKIWEPACGDGRISKILESFGKLVISSDLVNRGYGSFPIDFLKVSEKQADLIITNPPYKLAKEFVLHAMDLKVNTTAMLLRLPFLESLERLSLFNKYPPKWVAVFSKRIQMTKNNEIPKYTSGIVPYAWFIWEYGFSGYPQIDWI